jgi:hypothetical protein
VVGLYYLGQWILCLLFQTLLFPDSVHHSQRPRLMLK